MISLLMMTGNWFTGIDLIVALQSMGNSFWDAYFLTVTRLGDEVFYILALPIIYWAVDKRFGFRLSALFLVSIYANGAVKDWVANPRPSAAEVRVLKPNPSYAFPSGHAQGTATVWGYLAYVTKKAWVWVLAAAVVFSVALSRVYLGLHYPVDLVGGLGLAILFIAALLAVDAWQRRTQFAVTIGFPGQLALAAILPLLLLVPYSVSHAILTVGFLWGLTVGYVVEEEFVRFQSSGRLWQQLVKVALGLVILLALRQGLKLVLPDMAIGNFIRYAIAGLWASVGAPWVFVKTGLAAKE